MTPTTTTTDPLVEVLSARMRRMDVVAWQRIACWAEQFDLSFEQLRLLLALTTADGPAQASELAELAGLSLRSAYPAIHALRARGYLREEQRRYALTAHGRDLIAGLNAARRDGIQAYVDRIDPDERRQLEEALLVADPAR